MGTAPAGNWNQLVALHHRRQSIVSEGTKSLNRLIPVALARNEESRVAGRFLLGLYNGEEHPFDLTQFRKLDVRLFVDCMNVLVMDFDPQVEMHERLEDGPAIWRRLVKKWGARSAVE